MRTILYTLLIVFSVSGCRTVEKMVEQGRYDEAFAYSVNHLAGKKKKKRKYVVALEKAYSELNQRDLDEIRFLNDKKAPASWDRIYFLYEKIEKRYALVRPLIPLTSSDGYTANFERFDFAKDKVNLAELSAEYHYQIALDHMRSARNGDKRAARRAVTSLNNIEAYFSDYKDSRRLRDEAHDLGIEIIAIEFAEQGGGYFNHHIAENVSGLDYSRLNSFWERFIPYSEGQTADHFIVVDIGALDLGIEREIVHHHSFSKEVEDGFDLIQKTVVEEKTVAIEDKTDNDKKVGDKNKEVKKIVEKTETEKKAKFKTVRAEVTEIKREKLSGLSGGIRIYTRGQDFAQIQRGIQVRFDFYDEAVRMRGDREAVPDAMCKRFDDVLADFPSDIFMAEELSDKFVLALVHEIQSVDFMSL